VNFSDEVKSYLILHIMRAVFFYTKVSFPTAAQSELLGCYMFRLPILAIIRKL